MEMNNTKFMLHRAPCELSTHSLETLHMRIVTHHAPCELSTIATPDNGVREKPATMRCLCNNE